MFLQCSFLLNAHLAPIEFSWLKNSFWKFFCEISLGFIVQVHLAICKFEKCDFTCMPLTSLDHLRQATNGGVDSHSNSKQCLYSNIKMMHGPIRIRFTRTTLKVTFRLSLSMDLSRKRPDEFPHKFALNYIVTGFCNAALITMYILVWIL